MLSYSSWLTGDSHQQTLNCSSCSRAFTVKLASENSWLKMIGRTLGGWRKSVMMCRVSRSLWGGGAGRQDWIYRFLVLLVAEPAVLKRWIVLVVSGDKTDTRQIAGCSSVWGRRQLLDKTSTAAAGSWLFRILKENPMETLGNMSVVSQRSQSSGSAFGHRREAWGSWVLAELELFTETTS